MGMQPLDLTFISYDHGDLLSTWAAYTSLVPLALLAVMLGWVLARRELEGMFGYSGLFVNEVVNWCLKHAIKQPRPPTSLNHGYGMPSSHTQLMFFFATYIALWCYRTTPTTAGVRAPAGQPAVDCGLYIAKPLMIVVSLTTAIAVGVSRVVLGVHTIDQVVCGAIAGTVVAWLWHTVVGDGRFIPSAVRGLIPFGFGGGIRSQYHRIEEWSICSVLRIHDSTYINDVISFEHYAHRDWHERVRTYD